MKNNNHIQSYISLSRVSSKLIIYTISIFCIISCNINGTETIKDISSITYHQNIEIEPSKTHNKEFQEPETNLEKIKMIENTFNTQPSQYYHFEPKEKETFGKDNTLKALKVLEETKCQWEFYAFETKNEKKRKYFDEYLMGCKFMYKKNKGTDHKNIESNLVFLNKKDSIIYLTDKLFFQPIKGKRMYRSKIEKIKLLCPHKHLGPRDGCFMTIQFPEDVQDNTFRCENQYYKLKKIIYNYSTGRMYLKLVTKTPNTWSSFLTPVSNLIPKNKRKYKKNRLKNKDVIYLRTLIKTNQKLMANWEGAYDGDDRTITSPEEFLNEEKTVHNKSRKYAYYTATGAIATAVVGTTCAISALYFNPWSPVFFLAGIPS